VSGQSLFYLGESDIRHKIPAIVEEEGAERASYALKLLQSEGELTIASTGKDPVTGRLVTQEYRVEGPVSCAAAAATASSDSAGRPSVRSPSGTATSATARISSSRPACSPADG